jgi:N6-adenosine-specific RNA methylase IME4
VVLGADAALMEGPAEAAPYPLDDDDGVIPDARQWPFEGLEPGRYSAILADPPWNFAVRSAKGDGRSAKNHYGTMSLADIKALPVADLAAPDCALLLWATDPMLPQALDVMKAWGFTYKTVGFYWTKTNKDGSPFVGCGYWTRANPEQCLLGVRGAPKRINRDVRRLIIAPRRQHSRKPDETRAHVERLVPGPYCELFARESAANWSAWGNQATKFDTDHHARLADDAPHDSVHERHAA